MLLDHQADADAWFWFIIDCTTITEGHIPELGHSAALITTTRSCLDYGLRGAISATRALKPDIQWIEKQKSRD